MKREFDRDLLIEDIFAAEPSFREETLARTLVCARQERQVRERRRAMLLTSLPVLLLIAALSLLQEQQPLSPESQSRRRELEHPHVLVRSEPLSPGVRVKTQPGSVSIFSSQPLSLAVVRTKSTPGLVARISDQELFEWVGDQPAVLIRHSPGQAQLVLLETSDLKQGPY